MNSTEKESCGETTLRFRNSFVSKVHVPRRGRLEASKSQGLMQRSVNYLMTLVAKEKHSSRIERLKRGLLRFILGHEDVINDTCCTACILYRRVNMIIRCNPFTAQSLSLVGTICVITMFGPCRHEGPPLCGRKHFCNFSISLCYWFSDFYTYFNLTLVETFDYRNL